MTADLRSHLRTYGAFHDQAQAEVLLDDVIGAGPVVLPLSEPESPRRPRGRVVAVAAFILVAVIGTIVLLLTTGDDTTGFVDDGTAPPTTAVPPTTVTPLTTSGDPGGSAVPSGWCGAGSPPPGFGEAAESVAWAADGSRWEIRTIWPNVELQQTLPDGSVVRHPPPAIEDFELPPWALQGLEGEGELLPFDLEVTSDGRVWLSNSSSWAWTGSPYGVLRYDPESSTWENIEMLPGRTVPVSGIEATCDGSLWALVIDWRWREDGGELLEAWWVAHIDADGVVTRIDVDLPPGTPAEAAPGRSDGPPMWISADDRAVWLANGPGVPTLGSFVFSGVARYDGAQWTRFLDGELVALLTLYDDGTATADLPFPDPGTPEMVLIEP